MFARSRNFVSPFGLKRIDFGYNLQLNKSEQNFAVLIPTTCVQ